jgi:DNA-binding NarL/FixJ family response regulator
MSDWSTIVLISQDPRRQEWFNVRYELTRLGCPHNLFAYDKPSITLESPWKAQADLLVLELSDQEGSWLTTLPELRAAYRKAKIVAVSAFDLSEKAIACGADGFLSSVNAELLTAFLEQEQKTA